MYATQSQNVFCKLAHRLAITLICAFVIVVCLAVENEYKDALQTKMNSSRHSISSMFIHLDKKPLLYRSLSKSKNMSLVQQQALSDCEPVAQEIEFKLGPAIYSYEDVYGGLSSLSFGTYPGYEFDEGYNEFFPYSFPPCQWLCFYMFGTLYVWPVCLVIWHLSKLARFFSQMSIQLFYPN